MEFGLLKGDVDRRFLAFLQAGLRRFRDEGLSLDGPEDDVVGKKGDHFLDRRFLRDGSREGIEGDVA